MNSESFFEDVYSVVKRIPRGKVLNYGRVAAMCGRPRASRIVGCALHVNPYFGKVPCHRVVFADGSLAKAFAFGGESELKGFLAGVPKKSCRKTLDDIQNNLNASSVDGEVVITAEEKSHTLATVLGFIFALLIPIIGIIFGIYLMTRSDSENAKKYGIIIILVSVVIFGVSRMLLL